MVSICGDPGILPTLCNSDQCLKEPLIAKITLEQGSSGGPHSAAAVHEITVREIEE